MTFAVLEGLERTSGLLLLRFPYSTAITVAISIPVWVTVTLLTGPVNDRKLEEFFLRVRPEGAGWKRIRERLPEFSYPEHGRHTGARILLGIAAINGALIGTGKLILGEPGLGSALLILAAICSAGIFRLSRQQK
jgi:hypothetical protein